MSRRAFVELGVEDLKRVSGGGGGHVFQKGDSVAKLYGKDWQKHSHKGANGRYMVNVTRNGRTRAVDATKIQVGDELHVPGGRLRSAPP